MRIYKHFIIIFLSANIGLNAAMANNTIHVTTNQPTQVLQRIVVPGTHYEVGMGLGKMAPNTMKSWRIQSGPEMVYVLEGELILMLKGQPPKIIKAGESFQIPQGVLHETKAGPKGAQFLATWVVEQGKQNQFVVPVK